MFIKVPPSTPFTEESHVSPLASHCPAPARNGLRRQQHAATHRRGPQSYQRPAAADRAAQIAYDYGGYVSDSQMWKAGNDIFATVTLAVPVAQFDSAREAVLRLGTLVNEILTGDPLPGGYGAEWYNYSTLTVNLRPVNTARVWPAPPGWNPADTAGRAFGVFFLIFRWIVDAALWVAVVAGPFVLMGLGLRSLLRRASKSK